MKPQINEYSPYIQYRDLEIYVDELKSELEVMKEDVPENQWEDDVDIANLQEDFDSADEFRYELESFGRDAMAIHEDEFPEYCTQWFKDACNDEDVNLSIWPYNHIDWYAAAAEMKKEYAEITFRGETYLVR